MNFVIAKVSIFIQMVRRLIKIELDKYSADRLGKFDFALHSAGKITNVCFIVDVTVVLETVLF